MSEFTRIAKHALVQLEAERPRVIVPLYCERKNLIEQVIRGVTPDSQLTDVLTYVSNTSLLERHRIAIMFGWLTGYGSVPAASEPITSRSPGFVFWE